MGAARSNHGQQGCFLLRTCDTKDDAVPVPVAAQRSPQRETQCHRQNRGTSPVPGFGFEGGDLLRW